MANLTRRREPRRAKAPAKSKTRHGGHLAFYEAHGIAPVDYRPSDLTAHLDRRDSLYRSLGLPPIAFKGCRVLEIAPGTGQNSLFVAACEPASLDLVEPNPASLAAIGKTFATFQHPHTRPSIHALRFEEFSPRTAYDIVLCENWLGALPAEVGLLSKLAGLVAPGGVLVITFVPLSGFFPNIMRKLLALRLLQPDLDFASKTALLVDAFGPHLSTMAHMTRSHRDWVQDCLINPHYLNVGLQLETALAVLGRELEALATFPSFATDWRWFKGLTGPNRRFNENLRDASQRNVHNFIDSRRTWPERSAHANAGLEAAFSSLHQAALAWQAAFERQSRQRLAGETATIGRWLETIASELTQLDPDLGASVQELIGVWNGTIVTAQGIREMRRFSSLFGRETGYLALTRPRAA